MIEIPVWLATMLTAIGATYFGYLIAVRKFKKEKIWQEKYLAYQEVLNALETMILWADETYYDNKLLPTIGATASISFSGARRSIARVSIIGELLIAPAAIETLKELKNELWREDFRADDERYTEENHEEFMAKYAENVREILEPRLKKIIATAKIDLS
jgi:hypothetical protein